MDKKEIKQALQIAKENSPKRNFKQTVDLIITLKGLDLKKPDQQVDTFINLHYPRPRRAKICALVGPELIQQAKEAFDFAVETDDFANYSNKKDVKKLADDYDFFVAQGAIMTKVAQVFGRALGPRGKMPNPKAGCVVPPNANLKQVAERLQLTVQLKVKTHLMLQAPVGYEDTDEDMVIDNINTIYDQLIHNLPQEKNNIKAVVLKLTMGKPIVIGDKNKGS